MNKDEKILKDALTSNHLLSDDEYESYANSALEQALSVKEFLITNDILAEKQILIALSQSLNLPTTDLSDIQIEEEVINRVPIKFAWYYKFIPMKIEGNILTIACSSAMDIKTQDEIRNHVGYEVNVMLTEESNLVEALKKHYGLASDTIDRIMTKDPPKKKGSSATDEKWVEDLDAESENPTVSNLVNQIILEAYKKRATDIHIEPYRNKLRFRYRIDGVLVDANLPSEVKHFLQPILSRIKILANLSITEKRLPQDGSAVVKTKEQQLDLRVSTMPTPRGESMVIRILPTKMMLLSLDKLGFNKDSRLKIQELIKKPHGIIFMTGPTGSGKTTTLYACLNEINSSERKIITIEDPVEYEVDGITQVQVNPKVDFHFSTGLRSILRHDPDIIMVGEVRDLETAEIAIRTALTGHLVFSTLHTNDAASGVTRLIDMGVEPYLVANSVESFVAQRLVRMICKHCKEEDKEAPAKVKTEIAKAINADNAQAVKISRGRGCDHCNQTGYYGRMAIYEILTLNDAIRAAILQKPRSDYIKQIAMKEGLITLRQNGWKAVADGLTTPEEVLNITSRDQQETLDDKQSSKKSESLDVLSSAKVLWSKKIKKRDSWTSKEQFDSRIYVRSYEPIEIRYQLVNQDPQNPNALISEGIEHATVTENISAGGLKFTSKILHNVGSIVELKINLGKNTKEIECLAKVCRVEENSFANVYSIVTYYLDISSADRATINNFVQSQVNDENRVDLPKEAS